MNEQESDQQAPYTAIAVCTYRPGRIMLCSTPNVTV